MLKAKRAPHVDKERTYQRVAADKNENANIFSSAVLLRLRKLGCWKKVCRNQASMLVHFLVADENQQIVPLLRLLLTTNAVFPFAVNICGMWQHRHSSENTLSCHARTRKFSHRVLAAGTNPLRVRASKLHRGYSRMPALLLILACLLNCDNNYMLDR